MQPSEASNTISSPTSLVSLFQAPINSFETADDKKVILPEHCRTTTCHLDLLGNECILTILVSCTVGDAPLHFFFPFPRSVLGR